MSKAELFPLAHQKYIKEGLEITDESLEQCLVEMEEKEYVRRQEANGILWVYLPWNIVAINFIYASIHALYSMLNLDINYDLPGVSSI